MLISPIRSLIKIQGGNLWLVQSRLDELVDYRRCFNAISITNISSQSNMFRIIHGFLWIMIFVTNGIIYQWISPMMLSTFFIRYIQGWTDTIFCENKILCILQVQCTLTEFNCSLYPSPMYQSQWYICPVGKMGLSKKQSFNKAFYNGITFKIQQPSIIHIAKAWVVMMSPGCQCRQWQQSWHHDDSWRSVHFTLASKCTGSIETVIRHTKMTLTSKIFMSIINVTISASGQVTEL